MVETSGSDQTVYVSADLEALWSESRFESGVEEADEGYWEIDDCILRRLIIRMLADAGAEELNGSWEDSLPMACSAYSFLFADKPALVVSKALERLSKELAEV